MRAISTSHKQRDWCPGKEVVVLGQACRSPLVKLSRFTVQNVFAGRPDVKFGLHVGDVHEPAVDRI